MCLSFKASVRIDAGWPQVPRNRHRLYWVPTSTNQNAVLAVIREELWPLRFAYQGNVWSSSIFREWATKIQMGITTFKVNMLQFFFFGRYKHVTI